MLDNSPYNHHTKPLISIITPAYCSANVILDAIASVQAQDYENWEMLIVDDGSTDDTAAIVEQQKNKDQRICLIRQSNGGPWAARQTAVDHARGDYVAFLDSDDFWLPNKLSNQLAFMEKNNAAISYTNFRRISMDGTTVGSLIEVPDTIDYHGLLCNTVIATSTVLVNRTATGAFRLKNTYYDDFALWLEILKRGYIGYGLKEDLMRYRVAGGSVSRNKWKSARMVWRVYRDVEGLNPIYAAWCFSQYALNALKKYSKF